MSYQTEINQTEQAQRAELFKFTMGNESWYYTSFQETVLFQTNYYLPRAITRSDFSTDNFLKAIKTNVGIPIVDPIVKMIAIAPFMPITVDIIRCYLSDPDVLYRVIFSGVVYGISVENLGINAECVSDGGILDKQFPRIFYQTYCNHNLFDPQCKLNGYDYRIQGTLTAGSGTALTINAATNYVSGYFSGGRIVKVSTGDMRLITAHSGASINILVGIPDFTTGAAIELYPGCNGEILTCRNKFGNNANFVGFPYIPTRNPLIWGFR